MIRRLAMLAALTSTAPDAYGQDPQTPPPLEMKKTSRSGQAEGTRTLKLTATVTAVDVPNRTVTLQQHGGKPQTFTLGSQVTRLSEVAVGDTVTIDYKEELKLQLVSPSGETSTQAVVVRGGNRATQGPGGAGSAAVQTNVRVLAINRPERTVVLEGPNGKRYQVRADASISLEMLRVGDTLLATHVQSLAVNLVKPQ